MARWELEPGHTAAEFCVRHMMVTWVRGHFKNVHGTLEFDPDAPERSSVEAVLHARGLWAGDPQRGAHLKSGGFLDAQEQPTVPLPGSRVKAGGPSGFTR